MEVSQSDDWCYSYGSAPYLTVLLRVSGQWVVLRAYGN